MRDRGPAPGRSRRPQVAWRLLEALDRRARTAPAAVAVDAPDGRLTFAEVAAQSRALAAALAAAGAGPETSVGLALGRSRRVVPALLAVWRAGACAVLLDGRHGRERVAHVLRDGRVALLLGDDLPDGVESRPPALDLAAALDAAPVHGAAPARAAAPAARASPANRAYTVYTSGTTGWPKGVDVTYEGLDTFLAALGGLGLPPGGLGLNAVSPAFDGWLWCTLLYLLHGQGVALVDLGPDAGADLDERLAALRPRTVSLTPSLLATCRSDLSWVELLVVAGETCPPGLVERHGHGRRMLNAYGPTETTIAATWADSAAGDDVRTIGRPLPGYRAYVLDDDLEPVAPGETGELYVGGPALARGYRGQPGLTAERFLPDPFAADGGRMYRTGDLVTQRADGCMAFAGRGDDQVKVRGFRVELAEIERVAAAAAGVAAAACYVSTRGDALGLAVVPAGAAGADARTLAERVRRRCADRLPAALVPAAVEVVAALPTSPNGKVDRALLAGRAAAPAGGRPPASERERQVCAVWGELLERDVDDVDRSFFDLGGHSLLAARAVAALRRATGLPVTMRQLLEHPTAAGLAAVLDEVAAAGPAGTQAR